MNKFEHISLAEGAHATVGRLNTFVINLGLNNTNHSKQRKTAKDCPLVWDTGASFGLTPFRSDFIDYTACEIPVNDIARTNIVIGIGTTLHRFELDGEPFYLPCLSYHLPSADVRLFSPQTYHTIYGGHSAVLGEQVDMFIDQFKLNIPINREGSNVPIIFNCNVSASEMKEHGPFIRSALPKFERMADALGTWSTANFASWKIST
jgi:hypothetical protein